MKHITVLLITVFLITVSLGAADFGLILDQSAGASGEEEAAFTYEASLIPRLSALLGDSGDLYLSAAMTYGYDEDSYYVPELLRTEFSWRFGDAKLSAGRMHYSAPFTHAAEGLFDGLQLLYDSPAGTFNAGVWYTGLLYKKRANITITGEDAQSCSDAVDYDNFPDTYFASRRMVAALGWEHPALAESFSAGFSAIIQADFNDRDDRFNSQYLTAKIGIPAGRFMFELGGALELTQISAPTGDDTGIGLAGELGAFWTLPAAFPSRLSLSGYFSSGKTEDGSLAAFVPITAKSYGDILEAAPSGISALSLDYTARPGKTFSAGLTSTYFIRGDRGTFAGYPVDEDDKDGYLLGNEFFARLIWSPVSDLQINLGGGMFLPSMGNAAPEREPEWRIKLAVVLALY